MFAWASRSALLLCFLCRAWDSVCPFQPSRCWHGCSLLSRQLICFFLACRFGQLELCPDVVQRPRSAMEPSCVLGAHAALRRIGDQSPGLDWQPGSPSGGHRGPEPRADPRALGLCQPPSLLFTSVKELPCPGVSLLFFLALLFGFQDWTTGFLCSVLFFSPSTFLDS